MNTEARIHVACPQCAAVNRVPSARLAEDPVCGRCAQALLEGRPVELAPSRFDAVVSNTELPVLVDFWAPWCGPCRAMAPQFEAAARQLKGQALLLKVNSDEAQALAARYRIQSIPTLIRFDAGQERRRHSGLIGAAQIVAMAR